MSVSFLRGPFGVLSFPFGFPLKAAKRGSLNKGKPMLEHAIRGRPRHGIQARLFCTPTPMSGSLQTEPSGMGKGPWNPTAIRPKNSSAEKRRFAARLVPRGFGSRKRRDKPPWGAFHDCPRQRLQQTGLPVFRSAKSGELVVGQMETTTKH